MKLDLRSAIVLTFAMTGLVDRAARAQAPTTERVSVASSGAEGDGQTFGTLSVSVGGRYVAFCSTATNLIPGGTNSLGQIYVRDRLSGTTEIVSVSSTGVQGDNGSHSPSISSDGRFIAFESASSNLDPLVLSAGNVFVHDRATGATAMLDVTPAGVQGNGGAQYPTISADGRYVAFVGSASNLVAGDTNAFRDAFVRDRATGSTTRVNVSSGGVEANGDSAATGVFISADGRFVAFSSQATNLVPGDTNGYIDGFVHDRQTGTTERVSVDSSGGQGNQKSAYGGVFLSADGRYSTFTTFATNLVPGDTNGYLDVLVHDRLSGTTERVNLAQDGSQANRASGTFAISISGDGRYVTFDSQAYNLVAGTSGLSDVYLRDRLTGTTELVSVDAAGMPVSGHSNIASISGDGRFVAFQSSSATLVPGDTNAVADDFIRDRGVPSPTVYCTSGTTSNGCVASIAASANPSVSSAHACMLTVSSVEGQKSGLLFYGIDNAGFTPAAWAPGSASFFCVKAPTQRAAIQNSGGTVHLCNGSLVLDWNAYQSAHPLALGNPWSQGDHVYVQSWFRDPLAVKSTNLSNAIEMTYVP
jgi:Tol biopolymer transport system component